MLFIDLFETIIKEFEYSIARAKESSIILVNTVSGKIELCGNGKDYYHYVYKTSSDPLINPVTKEIIDFDKEIEKYVEECQKLQQVRSNIC